MSRFEANVLRQPELLAAALERPAPAWLKPPARSRKVFFCGVGTNHHAAQIAAWLWSSKGFDARAVHAHDFVSRPYRLSKGDLGVFLSHRGGSRSYTVRAEALARRAGAETVAVCADGAVWKGPRRRLDTCSLEDTGAFTKSFTTTMAWLLRWAGAPPCSLRSAHPSCPGVRRSPA
ncbi:MAG: SIS domain-containing protein [Elusimicrobiota bacterium]|nr:MAG: SIS domain-containing protein [Elusimicrobiota bacterium]